MEKEDVKAVSNLPVVQPPPVPIGGTVITPAALFRVPARRPLEDGPWRGEYEKISWVDQATGLNCIILRQRDGTLSGYVGVEIAHPLFGYAHEAVPDALGLHIHGGLTYASRCEAKVPEPISVCHTPSRPAKKPQLNLAHRSIDEDVWWFGFDTNHETDLVPMGQNRALRESGQTYRDQHFVYRECVRLAAGLAAIAQGQTVDPEPALPDDVAGDEA